MRIYADYAEQYSEAGFSPIPAEGKRVLIAGYHGREAPLVSRDKLSRWRNKYPDSNIAARLPRDVIGIDVDAYGAKHGDRTLEKLEDELGLLPATLVSTARHDLVSGIRLYRIPERYWSVIWPGKAGPGIDIIWHGNRYMIVWPSVHPDTNGVYLWYDQNDNGDFVTRADGIPDFDDLPDFPRSWCDYFARIAHDAELADVSDTEQWVADNGAGPMCDYMEEISGSVELADNAHDNTRDGLIAICREMARGHTGGAEAVTLLRGEFIREIAGRSSSRRRTATSEWNRLLDGAVRRAATLMKDGRPSVDPCITDYVPRDTFPTRETRDIILWADDVEETRVDWLQKPLLPFGSVVITDGDPGQGKTLITQNAVAKATRGEPLFPFGDHCGRAINCGIIGAEDDLNSVVIGRLRAAGWQRGERNVAFLKLKRRKGKIEQLTFPEGTERVRQFIMTGSLELVVVDPVTSFLGENVRSHVDASVRAALGPLLQIAQDTGCCIWLIRHLNKDGSMKAIYRGGGSIAFSALARSGMITGRIPDDSGWYGMAHVKCNHGRRMETTLAYSIEEWPENPDIPIIVWHGEADVSADELVSGPRKKPGPAADMQDEVESVLKEMFEERDTWPAKEAFAEIRAAGCPGSAAVVGKARAKLGIRTGNQFGEDGRIQGWVWTTETRKLRGMR